MLLNLLYGSSAMALCLMLQATLVVRILAYYQTSSNQDRTFNSWYLMRVLIGVMLGLVISNFLQIIIWGILFILLGEFSDFYAAIYHSAVNFSTLGYGDIVMSDEHRLLGPLQAINGVLMIGFSTAVLMAVIQDLLKRGGTHLKERAEDV